MAMEIIEINDAKNLKWCFYTYYLEMIVNSLKLLHLILCRKIANTLSWIYDVFHEGFFLDRVRRDHKVNCFMGASTVSTVTTREDLKFELPESTGQL